jgi:hypothetical protein
MNYFNKNLDKIMRITNIILVMQEGTAKTKTVTYYNKTI